MAHASMVFDPDEILALYSAGNQVTVIVDGGGVPTDAKATSIEIVSKERGPLANLVLKEGDRVRIHFESSERRADLKEFRVAFKLADTPEESEAMFS